MKIKTTFLLIMTLLIIFFNATNAQKPAKVKQIIPEGVEVTKNIKYIGYDDRELLLDVYLPNVYNGKALPTIITIRGGGWKAGDKEGYTHIAASLASKGFATVCIEYRASGEKKFPAAVFDIKAAVKWIKENATKYNFDSSAIGAIGGSAGAHLAMLLGVSSKIGSLNPDTNIVNYNIQAVVGMATPSNLSLMPNAEPIIDWLDCTYSENEKKWISASPSSYIDNDSPPMLLIHSSSDRTVPFEQSVEAVSKMGEQGVYAELILIPYAPHAFWNFEKWFPFAMDKASLFFHEQLKK